MLSNNTASSFSQLDLAQPILSALAQVGYQAPSPIQSQTIPLLLQGKDVLGQAQTGTGKTAAFALPLLSRVQLANRSPQVLVLAPTRELAIQVAESFTRYARYLDGFTVAPIYGGQDYSKQIKQLKKGVHIVVGTPGRVMDHMRRGTLDLSHLNSVVLDEADEMLRMGFIDDVEWILEQTPKQRQVALFSATMPSAIRQIAQRYLNQPEEITIKREVKSIDNIRQRVLLTKGISKYAALTRILQTESFNGLIIFVRTKSNTVELANDLKHQGYAAAALNGDIAQNQREQIVEQLKQGKIDILVATDVAARGLDVERITHVINYDIPFNSEAYTHRIGRTGRAGRKGDAILLINAREKRLVKDFERATNSKLENMTLPSIKEINELRVKNLSNRIIENQNNNDHKTYRDLLLQLQQETDLNPLDIAASLATLLYEKSPLLLEEEKITPKAASKSTPNNKKRGKQAKPTITPPAEEMQRYRLAVGKVHGVRPKNIVGAIANEAGLESQFIQQVNIFDDYSTVDLPEGMPKAIYKDLRKTWVCGQQLQICTEDTLSKVSHKSKVRKNKRSKAKH